MALISTNNWTGDTGENYVTVLHWDGTWLWAGLSGNPIIVVKLDPDTLEEQDRWTGDTGEDDIFGIVSVGIYIYFGITGATGRAEIIELVKTTLAESNRWIGAADETTISDLATDGTYIYGCSNASSTGKVFQIDPSGMTENARLTGGTNELYYSLAMGGTYLFSSHIDTSTSPRTTVVQAIDISSMTVDHSFSEIVSNTAGGSVFVNTTASLVYANLLYSPGQLVSLDEATLAEQDRWTGDTGENIPLSSTDGDSSSFYAGLFVSPGKLVKINKADMSKNDLWTGATGENFVYSTAFDGTYAYVGLYTAPGQVIKIHTESLWVPRIMFI